MTIFIHNDMEQSFHHDLPQMDKEKKIHHFKNFTKKLY